MVKDKMDDIEKIIKKEYIIEDVIGLDEAKEIIHRQLVLIPKYKKELIKLGKNISVGLLLYGYPGTGKTFITKAMINIYSNETTRFFLRDIGDLSGSSQEDTAKKINSLFKELRSNPNCQSVLILDEIDVILPKRSKNNSPISTTRTSSMLKQLDGIEDNDNIFIIGTTNRPFAIESAFKRSGRFDEEVFVDFPTKEERIQLIKQYILTINIEKLTLGFLNSLAEHTKDFTGADFNKISTLITLDYLIKRDKEPNYVISKEELFKYIDEFSKKKRMTNKYKEEYMKSYIEYENKV